MIDGYRMMLKLHSRLLEDTAEAQSKLLHLRQLMKEFGDDTVPPDRLLRGYNSALAGAPQTLRSLAQRYEETIAENLEAARSLEKVFAERDAEHMADFAEWARQSFSPKPKRK